MACKLHFSLPGDARPGGSDSSGDEDLSYGKPLQGPIGKNLLVLTIARTKLNPAQLADTLAACPLLESLDASRCGLASVPAAHTWAGLARLAFLFLHQNQFRHWDSVEPVVKPPNLEWLTLFGNPITSQPLYRCCTIEKKPTLLALDYWLITDNERLGSYVQSAAPATPRGGDTPCRFFKVEVTSTLASGQADPSCSRWATSAMVQRTRHEVWQLRHRSNHCSAACCIQALWRGFRARKMVRAHRANLDRVCTFIQRHVKLFLWRLQMTSYLKKYLEEIDEVDLLASAREIAERKALKIIEDSLRRWVRYRRNIRNMRKAGNVISRITRGFLARQELMFQYFDTDTYLGIFFPEKFAWEFHILLNVLSDRYCLPRLPADHVFESADVMGIRFPETGDVPVRKTCLLTVLHLGEMCIVRPVRGNRYPEHPWDGPLHQLVDKTAPERIQQAYTTVRRRSANVNNRCRRAFLGSCRPGAHPIDTNSGGPAAGVAGGAASAASGAARSTRRMLFTTPESKWPPEARTPGTLINMFMLEAERLGSKKLVGRSRATGAAADPETGLRSYRDACWLSQKMLVHRCDSPRTLHRLMPLINEYSTYAGDIPFLEPIAFLSEKLMRRISSATVIQATYRAHLARCKLRCSLRTAAALRRAAICIQRWWRWGLLKRRLEFFAHAIRYLHTAKGSCFYLEERLFGALNIINSFDRYPPLMKERAFRFGYSERAESIVLVCESLRGRRKSRFSRVVQEHRATGLPAWFEEHLCDIEAVGPDDPTLKRVSGLQGLLTEGLSERIEEQLITVSVPRSSAPVSTLRFVELRYHTAAEARKRALLLFMCTFNAQHRLAVPWLSKPMLIDTRSFKKTLQIRELYGLTWSANDRGALHQVRQQAKCCMEAVPWCGTVHLLQTARRDGREDCSDAPWSARRREAAEEATRQRFAALSAQVEARRGQHEQEILEKLRDVSVEDVHRVLEKQPEPTYAFDFCVTGLVPNTTSARVEKANAAVSHAQKAEMQSVIAQARAAEVAQNRGRHAAVTEWLGTSGSGMDIESGALEFYGMCDEQKRHQQEQAVLKQRSDIASQVVPSSQHILAHHHKIAEREIVRKAELAAHLAAREQQRLELGRQLLATARRQDEELQQVRDRIESDRARKAEKRAVKEKMGMFFNNTCCIERVCRAADAAEARETREAKALKAAASRRQGWARRTRALAERHHACMEYQRMQVDELREHLDRLMDAKWKREDDELEAARARVADRRAVDRLLQSARGHLDEYQRHDRSEPGQDFPGPGGEEGAPGAAALKAGKTYEKILDVFRDLAQHMDADTKAGRDANASGPKGPLQSLPLSARDLATDLSPRKPPRDSCAGLTKPGREGAGGAAGYPHVPRPWKRVELPQIAQPGAQARPQSCKRKPSAAINMCLLGNGAGPWSAR